MTGWQAASLAALFAALSATAASSAWCQTSGAFFDDFDGPGLDASKWLVAHRNWGGKGTDGQDYNGGVIPANVSIADGMLRLKAFGDHYDGPMRGTSRDGTARSTGQRVGAAVATRAYFGSGRFEARMKIAPRLGVASSMWTFHYQEKPDGTIVNHEIDIELPGRPSPAPLFAAFDHALFSTHVGEGEAGVTTIHQRLAGTLADGDFHVYRFDWYAGAGTSPRVEFRIDGRQLATLTRTVPFIDGRLWLGAWFPQTWAGRPDFAESEMLVDWVRITPFAGQRTFRIPETYPDFGWAGGP